MLSFSPWCDLPHWPTRCGSRSRSERFLISRRSATKVETLPGGVDRRSCRLHAGGRAVRLCRYRPRRESAREAGPRIHPAERVLLSLHFLPFFWPDDVPESGFFCPIPRPAARRRGLSSTIVSAEVSGGAVESLARVRVQTALPSESCSTRPPGPSGRRGNFGRRILTVFTMNFVRSAGPVNEGTGVEKHDRSARTGRMRIPSRLCTPARPWHATAAPPGLC